MKEQLLQPSPLSFPKPVSENISENLLSASLLEQAGNMLSKMPEEHTIRSQFHSEQNRIKIIHVGAGAAGLITAYKAQRMLKNCDLTCYDKLVLRQDHET